MLDPGTQGGMATRFHDMAPRSPALQALADPARAITGPRFDAIFYWGAPLIAFAFVWAWVLTIARLPGAEPDIGRGVLAIGVAVLTYAHLIAVVPRAYLNAEVFATHRLRLTVVPALLIAGLCLSPALLIVAAVVAIFWDVHHSAMQTFGLARIYDMKAGNPPTSLRRTDLWMNWAMYVGPLVAGGSLMFHLQRFATLSGVGWQWATTVPPLAASDAGLIRLGGFALWLVCIGGALISYRRAYASGYRMPAHKAALLGTSATVSIAAWLLSPPLVAFTAINLFHAVQYFAIVWSKEGGRMRGALGNIPARVAIELFLLACFGFGLAYYYAANAAHWLMAPFVACSLLHFWYDGFVWSVRRRQV